MQELSCTTNIPSSIMSQPIWYNKNNKINSKSIFAENLQNKIVFFVWSLQCWRLVQDVEWNEN